MPPCQKVFYSSMVSTSLNLLDLISFLCLRHLFRCPLTITFLSFLGFFPLSLLNCYYLANSSPLVLTCLYPFNTLVSSTYLWISTAYLNISVYMYIILSFETLSYSVVKSLSFRQFVLPWSWCARTFVISHTFTFVYKCLPLHSNVCLKHFSLHTLDHLCFFMIHERSFYSSHP